MNTAIRFLLPALVLFAHACIGAPISAVSSDSAEHPSRVIYRFSVETGTSGWEIEDDYVMGGHSRGRLAVNEAGNAVFSGEISLANDGGFSSIQHDFGPYDVSGHRALVLGIKGDGQRSQVRVEASPEARHAYAFDFPTSGDWQTIEIPFNQMSAIRHGDLLDLPPYPGQTMARIQILAGEGRTTSFQLEIDQIWLK